VTTGLVDDGAGDRAKSARESRGSSARRFHSIAVWSIKRGYEHMINMTADGLDAGT
jgi:hypothetical protein